VQDLNNLCEINEVSFYNFLDAPEDGHKWLKHDGHYGHLLMKRLAAIEGTSEFSTTRNPHIL
jgi:hypothetical protein